MGAKGILAIGAGLIFVAINGAYVAHKSHERQAGRNTYDDEVVWTWNPAVDGHSGFAMIVHATTWSWMATDTEQGWTGDA